MAENTIPTGKLDVARLHLCLETMELARTAAQWGAIKHEDKEAIWAAVREEVCGLFSLPAAAPKTEDQAVPDNKA